MISDNIKKAIKVTLILAICVNLLTMVLMEILPITQYKWMYLPIYFFIWGIAPSCVLIAFSFMYKPRKHGKISKPMYREAKLAALAILSFCIFFLFVKYAL